MNNNLEHLLKIANDLHLNDEFQRAHDIYRAVISEDSQCYQAHHFLGILLLQNGFEKEGKESINKAISLRGDYPEAEANLASFGYSMQAKIAAEIDHHRKDLPEEWGEYETTSTNSWRHHRMMDFVTCLARPNESWLTIGDARGHDSIMLSEMGASKVVASNLDASLLELGNKVGMVGEYLEINAEKISLPDKCFDYILCKEALHHMPRPTIAIYEMLRVATKGVFLLNLKIPPSTSQAQKAINFGAI